MADTYTQLYVQIVFAVKGRQCLIPQQHKEELHRYITGVVQNRGAKVMAVHCMPDHVHLFVGFGPTLLIANLVGMSRPLLRPGLKKKRWVSAPFYWQEGYGAFSYSQSQVDTVVRYVLNQEAHHRRRTFKEEYLSFLEKFGLAYEAPYLFDFE